MPLIDTQLEGELINVYEKGSKGNRDPKTVGRKTAKAYFNYVKQGKDVGGGTFTAMPGNSQLIQKLGDIFGIFLINRWRNDLQSFKLAVDHILINLLGIIRIFSKHPVNL